MAVRSATPPEHGGDSKPFLLPSAKAQTSAAAHPVTRQRERPQVMPVATLGQAAIGVGGSTPGRTGTPRRQGGRRTKSPTPDPELVTACVGISVGNLDTSKEVG
jgi:hypothetical protein